MDDLPYWESNRSLPLQYARCETNQDQITDLVKKVVTESHTFPDGHGFPNYEPFTSITKELRYRELGDRRARMNKLWPSLLRSDNREFQLNHEMKIQGKTVIDCKRVVSSSGVVDLDEESIRGFTHARERFDGHGIRQFLAMDTDAEVRNGSYLRYKDHSRRVMEKYVILLTDLGQVRFYIEEGNSYVLVHRFNLPAHLFNFKSIQWNIEKDEIYVVGVSPRTHIDDIRDDQFPHGSRRSNSSPFTRSYCIATISVHPQVRIKYLVKLDSQMFGDIADVSLHGDAMICMSVRCTSIYDMKKIYCEYCESTPTHNDYGSPESDRVVVFNMNIKKKPQPLRVFFGSLYSIDIGCSMHAILQYNRGAPQCRMERCDGMEPSFSSQWPSSSSRLILRGESHTRFHPDFTSRILRLEGDRIACYSLTKPENEIDREGETGPSTVGLQWSVRLLPSVRTRGVSPSDEREGINGRSNMLHSIKFVNGNMLMIIVIYDVSTITPPSDAFFPSYLYCPIAIFIDATTGRRIRVTSVDNSIFYGDDAVQMGAGRLFSVGTSDDSNAKVIRVHQLCEKEPPVPEVNLKASSGVLNRKQRRMKRKADKWNEEMRGGRTTHLLPGFHEIV